MRTVDVAEDEGFGDLPLKRLDGALPHEGEAARGVVEQHLVAGVHHVVDVGALGATHDEVGVAVPVDVSPHERAGRQARERAEARRVLVLLDGVVGDRVHERLARVQEDGGLVDEVRQEVDVAVGIKVGERDLRDHPDHPGGSDVDVAVGEALERSAVVDEEVRAGKHGAVAEDTVQVAVLQRYRWRGTRAQMLVCRLEASLENEGTRAMARGRCGAHAIDVGQRDRSGRNARSNVLNVAEDSEGGRPIDPGVEEPPEADFVIRIERDIAVWELV